MKKYIPLLLITSLLLSSCSIDWNDEKDKRIAELEEKIAEIKSSKDLELEKFEFEKQKRVDNFREECIKLRDKASDQILKFLNSCTYKNCQEEFLADPKNKIPTNYVDRCLENKLN